MLYCTSYVVIERAEIKEIKNDNALLSSLS